MYILHASPCISTFRSIPCQKCFPLLNTIEQFSFSLDLRHLVQSFTIVFVANKILVESVVEFFHVAGIVVVAVRIWHFTLTDEKKSNYIWIKKAEIQQTRLPMEMPWTRACYLWLGLDVWSYPLPPSPKCNMRTLAGHCLKKFIIFSTVDKCAIFSWHKCDNAYNKITIKRYQNNRGICGRGAGLALTTRTRGQ